LQIVYCKLILLDIVNCQLPVDSFIHWFSSQIAYCQLSIDSIIFAAALKLLHNKNKE